MKTQLDPRAAEKVRLAIDALVDSRLRFCDIMQIVRLELIHSAVIKHGSQQKAAHELGVHRTTISLIESVYRHV